MIGLTTEQIDAMRNIRHQVNGDSVFVHRLPDPPRIYVVIWREGETEACWRGTISPAGTARTHDAAEMAA